MTVWKLQTRERGRWAQGVFVEQHPAGSFQTPEGRWRVQLRHRGRRFSGGTHHSFDGAHRALRDLRSRLQALDEG